jgi:membrane protein implicated in regulation of membrane protease activity
VIALVVAAWAGSIVLDAVGLWPDPPQTIGLAFMAVLSALLGTMVVQRQDRGEPPEVRARDRAEAIEADESKGTNQP